VSLTLAVGFFRLAFEESPGHRRHRDDDDEEEEEEEEETKIRLALAGIYFRKNDVQRCREALDNIKIRSPVNLASGLLYFCVSFAKAEVAAQDDYQVEDENLEEQQCGSQYRRTDGLENNTTDGPLLRGIFQVTRENAKSSDPPP